MTNGPQRESDPRALRIIMLVVAIWGGLLALGALLFGPHPETGAIGLAINPWRGLIVAGCVAFFLGGWWWLLKRHTDKKHTE